MSFNEFYSYHNIPNFRWILDLPTMLTALIVSSLTSFTGLSLLNSFIQWTGTLFGFFNFGLVKIVSYLFIPLLYVLGIPWSHILLVSCLKVHFI